MKRLSARDSHALDTHDHSELTATDLPGNKRGMDVIAHTGGMTDGISWDYVSVLYPDTVTEVYSFNSGGVSGTLVMTATVVYSDDTKERLVSATRVTP